MNVVFGSCLFLPKGGIHETERNIVPFASGANSKGVLFIWYTDMCTTGFRIHRLCMSHILKSCPGNACLQSALKKLHFQSIPILKKVATSLHLYCPSPLNRHPSHLIFLWLQHDLFFSFLSLTISSLLPPPCNLY